MGVATYNQEFECSFIGNVRGSIYGELITKLEDEKRIARVPYDPYPVMLIPLGILVIMALIPFLFCFIKRYLDTLLILLTAMRTVTKRFLTMLRYSKKKIMCTINTSDHMTSNKLISQLEEQEEK